LLLGRAHLLEFGGSHDLPGHRSILSLEQVSASRPRGVPAAFGQIAESTSGLSGTALGPYPSGLIGTSPVITWLVIECYDRPFSAR
jgi:hypothetical protein